MIERLLAPLVLLAMVLPVHADEVQPPPPPPRAVNVLLANVGTSNVWCQPYAFKLCFGAVEDRVAAGIQALRPDLIGLIEVMPPERCSSIYASVPEPDPRKVCSPVDAPIVEAQVRRLVGSGYSIACDARFGWDCIAVLDATGTIASCPAPECYTPRGLGTAPALEGCDPGFTVSATDVTIDDVGAFRAVLAHPDSGFTSGPSGATCREQQLTQMFELAEDHPALILGDLNMDPYRSEGPDVDLWREHVGDGARFTVHSGIAEHDPPFITHFAGESSNLLNTGELLPTIDDPSGAFARTTLDHVASDAFAGTCLTLGEAPGTTRLDGGRGGGMDHRALLCTLTAA